MEKDFDDYIDSLIEKPSIVSLVQELIKEGIVEVQANNYVNYPHLKEEAAGIIFFHDIKSKLFITFFRS